MRFTRFAALFLILATLAGCNHHGEFFHQNRPGGNDAGAAAKK